MKLLSASLAAAAAACFAPAPALAQAGVPVGGDVMFVSGRAERLGADGKAHPVQKGMQLLEGDRVRTQPDSHVYVRMRDGGLLVVRPASELHVDLWRFDAARPQDSRIKYTLDSGVARHVSGQGAKAAREKFRFNTPMAAIGVRGTDFTVLADPSVTRVSVASGGIIMNGFGDGCRAEGLGPCEGPSAVELFASAKDKLLQLRLGERRPEVIDEGAAAPDRSRPPAAGEPVAAQPLSGGVELADARGSEVAGQVIPAPPPPAPPAPPPVASAPPPAPAPGPAPAPAPEAAIAVWGRWAAVAENDAGKVDVSALLGGRSIVAINRMYALAASKPTMELPGAGTANFTLAAHDGYIKDKKTDAFIATTASDARLAIDFGTRRFDTSMTVSGEGVSTQIAGKGSIQADGKFTSDAFASPSLIQGIVGGKDGGQAMYLYQRTINSRYDAAGATSWQK